jgi:hypothetical protein
MLENQREQCRDVLLGSPLYLALCEVVAARRADVGADGITATELLDTLGETRA